MIIILDFGALLSITHGLHNHDYLLDCILIRQKDIKLFLQIEDYFVHDFAKYGIKTILPHLWFVLMMGFQGQLGVGQLKKVVSKYQILDNFCKFRD